MISVTFLSVDEDDPIAKVCVDSIRICMRCWALQNQVKRMKTLTSRCLQRGKTHPTNLTGRNLQPQYDVDLGIMGDVVFFFKGA